MVTLDKSRFSKIVTSPFTGQEYEIRRLSVRSYFVDMGFMPTPLPENLAEDLRAIAESVKDKLVERLTDKEAQSRIRAYTVERGVAAPKIWFGARAECPEGQVPAEDLGDDLNWLAAEITEFTFNLSFIREMKGFFRGANTGDSGPDGEAVRDEAVGPDA